MNNTEKIIECCFCKNKEKYGNNALPIFQGRCCKSCNQKIVIPFRIIGSKAIESVREEAQKQALVGKEYFIGHKEGFEQGFEKARKQTAEEIKQILIKREKINGYWVCSACRAYIIDEIEKYLKGEKE